LARSCGLIVQQSSRPLTWNQLCGKHFNRLKSTLASPTTCSLRLMSLRPLTHTSCALHRSSSVQVWQFISFWLHAGLVRHLRFTSSPNHLHLLLRLIEASPLIATAVLSSCALSPDPQNRQASCINAEVATRCMKAAAAPQKSPSLGSSVSSMVLEPPVSTFLLKCLPQRLSQV
jgi:hypothetical protein